MNNTINCHPEAECPHCGHSFDLSRGDMPEEGDALECPKCEREMHVSGVDWTVTITLSTHPPK